jgi:hypothetical protein
VIFGFLFAKGSIRSRGRDRAINEIVQALYRLAACFVGKLHAFPPLGDAIVASRVCRKRPLDQLRSSPSSLAAMAQEDVEIALIQRVFRE